MADGAYRLHIVCYDITCPRRLAKVHRHLVRNGIPLQYSVFLVRANKAGLLALMGELSDLIDPRTDDVRAYPLPTAVEYDQLGRQMLPPGVTLHVPGADSGLIAPAA